MAIIRGKPKGEVIPEIVLDVIGVLDDSLEGVDVELKHVEGMWLVSSTNKGRWSFGISEDAIRRWLVKPVGS